MRASRVRAWAALGVLLAAVSWPSVSSGQQPEDPDAVRAAQQAEPQPFAEGRADLSLVRTSGNSESQTLATSGELTLRPGSWEVLARASAMRNHSNGAAVANTRTATARLSRKFDGEVWAIFAEHQYLRDTFSGLESSHVTTAGLSYKPFNSDEHALSFDASVGRQSDRGARATNGGAALLGVSYRWAFGPTSDVSNATRWLVSFQHPDARRLETESALTVGFTSVLSLRLSYSLRHQNAARASLRQNDTILSTAIVATF